MLTVQETQMIVTEYIGERIDLDDLGAEVNIFEAGLVNSLFAIEIMTFLENTFAIKIGMGDLDMANFQSINAIVAFVQAKEIEKAK